LIKGNDKKTQFWDMTDEELERARLEKKKNKRSVAAGFFDPLRLWGSNGYIGKHFAKKRSTEHTRPGDGGHAMVPVEPENVGKDVV
jgi:hypothetical protein